MPAPSNSFKMTRRKSNADIMSDPERHKRSLKRVGSVSRPTTRLTHSKHSLPPSLLPSRTHARSRLSLWQHRFEQLRCCLAAACCRRLLSALAASSFFLQQFRCFCISISSHTRWHSLTPRSHAHVRHLSPAWPIRCLPLSENTYVHIVAHWL
jgi:hypothetical protein